MSRRYAHLALLLSGLAPIIIVSAQQTAPAQAPTSEQVFKNIKVFNGVPASDLIPAMEFMSASLGYQCTDCHDPMDYSIDVPKKLTARNMVIMQRDINQKNFNGRLEVTCMSCHNGKEHPAGAPIPNGAHLRHERIENGPKPEDLFSKHIAAVGKPLAGVTRIGTLTAPSDATHKIETNPLTFQQAEGGMFRLDSADRKVVSDGKGVWYGTVQMTDEPAAIFGRIGRAWQGEQAFAGLERVVLSGKDAIGKSSVFVVRASRPATTSTEELWFDGKSGLLLRLVNVRRSTIGSVISMIDYSNYKTVSGSKVPMRVVMTFAGNERWEMNFKSAKAGAIDASSFKGN